MKRLFLIVASLIIVDCLSAPPNRSIERQNAACGLVGPLPASLDADEIIDYQGDKYAPTRYTNQWIDFASREADCIRSAQCAEAWLAWDGNCAADAENRAYTIKGFLGFAQSCTRPQPTCKP